MDTDGDTDGVEPLDEQEVDVEYGRAPNPCKVSKFKDSTTGVIIESWFYQMEDYMELNGVPRGHWVKTCIANFNSQHYDQVRCHRYLPYREFKKKVIEIFKRPDMTQYKIKELWSAQQDDEEAPDAFMTRIRSIARQAFRRLAEEEQQTLAVHAFCEGLQDRGVAALVATQARNSAARAVRIAAEAIAVNSKTFPSKQREKTQEKALLSVSKPHTAARSQSREGSDFPNDSGNSRYQEEEELGVSLIGNDKKENAFESGDGSEVASTPKEASKVKVQVFCLRCQGFGHFIDLWTSPASLYNGDPNNVICFWCAKPGHMQNTCEDFLHGRRRRDIR